MKKHIVFMVVALVVVGGGSFYGGLAYAKNNIKNAPPNVRQFSGQAGAGNPGARFGNRTGGGDIVTGEIISKDDKSVTVKLRDGGSKIIFFSPSTDVTKSVTGSVTDLETNKMIVVNGKANSDGSVTATSIQVRPDAPPKPEQPKSN